MQCTASYTDHREFGWGGKTPISRRDAMTTTTVPGNTRVPEKRRAAIKWAGKEITVEKTLGGKLYPLNDGVAWVPAQGCHIKTLERTIECVYYALIRQNGTCDILVANSTGIHKAKDGEIPLSVTAKALAYSDGAFDGEMILPVYTSGLQTKSSSAPNTENMLNEERMKNYLWNTPPDDY